MKEKIFCEICLEKCWKIRLWTVKMGEVEWYLKKANERKNVSNCSKKKSAVDVAICFVCQIDFSSALEWKCDEMHAASAETFCGNFQI